MTLVLIAIGGVLLVLLVGVLILRVSDAGVLRARHEWRITTARKILRLAGNLEGMQLWIALPFPAFQPDPKALPEGWEAQPRRWVRVSGRSDSMVVLECGNRIEALGCGWYVYADGQGKGIDWHVESSDEHGPFVPPGIDPDSIWPPDLYLAGTEPGV